VVYESNNFKVADKNKMAPNEKIVSGTLRFKFFIFCLQKINIKYTFATEMPIKWSERKQVPNLSIESHYCFYTVTSVSNPDVKDKMISKILGMSFLLKAK
jgi:hypothetical protein